MTLKSDTKYKGKLTRVLKNDIRNLVNFHASSWKSKNLHFNRFLLSEAYKILNEKVKKNYLSWNWWVKQSLKSFSSLVAKNDITNLVNFNMSSGKSGNLHFAMLLLLIPCKVSAKKVQKSHLSWHWRMIQTLKKNSLIVWKMTWIIWWTLTQALENLKIYILMGYFC